MEVIIDDMIIYSASQSLIKTVSAGVGFFSVPAKAKAFLFKRKPGYKAHYRFTRALISIALRNIQLFNRHCCKVSDEAAFCLIQRPYISKTLLTRRISPRGSP